LPRRLFGPSPPLPLPGNNLFTVRFYIFFISRSIHSKTIFYDVCSENNCQKLCYQQNHKLTFKLITAHEHSFANSSKLLRAYIQHSSHKFKSAIFFLFFSFFLSFFLQKKALNYFPILKNLNKKKRKKNDEVIIKMITL
jgi:hypothetical protein